MASVRRSKQPLDRLMHRLVAEAEGAVMHRENVIGAAMVGHRPRLLGCRVRGDIGVIGADAEDREIDSADVFEVVLIRGISAVEDAAFTGLDEISIESAMLVEKR